MAEFWSALVDQAGAFSYLELLGVVAAIAYLLLAIRQNIWCWAFAAISTAIYVYLFIHARLYMESLLNGFYLAMAAYGWYSWTHGSGAKSELAVTSWRWHRHAAAIMLILAGAGLSGWLLETHTDAEFPYTDSLTTWSAIWATFLVARKVLENWWYWLAIDSVSVYLYWSRSLELTALLFIVYLVMIPFGLLSWRRSQLQADVAA
ncbi:MAG TPA: nicotinamide riboside transporter PnuC [Woeseiaceae bacterium]|nr:nicotinamide riboside transporter PnuC [Woeseiaceae bacterium]